MKPWNARPKTVVVSAILATLTATGCGAASPSGSSPASAIPPGPFAVNSSACPADAATPLAPGAPLEVGTVAPLSGPASATAGYSQGMKLYFDKLDAEQGGVEGHPLRLIAKDDQYDPTKTVPQVTSLVSQEKVFALLGQAGTANVAASEPLVERYCVPDLWAISGDTKFGDPGPHSWVTGGYTLYSVEATAWARYIAGQKPGATVAFLQVDNDAGATYSKFFTTAARKAGLNIVVTQKFAPTATNVDSQISAMLAEQPDYVVGAVLTSICGSFQNLLAQGGFRGGVLAPGYCGSKALLTAAGDAANGMVYGTAYRDPTNPANAGNADVQQFLSDVQKYGGGLVPSPFTIDGYRLARLFTDTVKRAAAMPGGLTRVNLMNAAWNLDTTLFDSYCGTAKTNGARDPFVDECVGLLRYDTTSGAKQVGSFDAEGQGRTLGE